MKQKIITPWNVPNYFPCNAFHPIYESLLLENHQLDFLKPTICALQSQIPAKSRDFSTPLNDKTFANFFSLQQLVSLSQNHDLIELHHTVPMAMSAKKFIFHCESFLPIFMPHAFQGQWFKTKPDTIRQNYRKILASNRCLGIISHIQETLDEIDAFFSDPAISKKLIFSPLPPPRSFVRALPEPRNAERPEMTFLFTSSFSSSASDRQFILRGGIASIKFAIEFLKVQENAKFTFQSNRPTDENLKEYKVDAKQLKRLETSENIKWISGHQTTSSIAELFHDHDFLLLPGANLHSATLTQALAAGTIPVCLDTPQVKSLLGAEAPAIFLHGHATKFYKKAAEGYYVDDHEEFLKPEIQNAIVQDLKSLLVDYASDKSRIADTQNDCRSFFDQNFNPETNAGLLTDKILSLVKDDMDAAGTVPIDKQPESHSFSLVTHADFEAEVRPKLLTRINHQELYESTLGYYSKRPSPQVRDPLCWALLTESTDGYKFFTSYSAAVDDMFLQVVGAPMPTQRWNWLKKLLRRNMTVHAIARYLYSRFRNLKAFILQPFPSMVAQVIPKDTLLYTLLRAVYRYAVRR